jgi:TM2 domain-containing membrane protein YozV
MYSLGIAYLLWLVSGLGALGLHRLYLGKIGTWILWMCTGGLFGLGSLYDLFTLPFQVKEANGYRAYRSRAGADYRTASQGDENSGETWRCVNDGEARVVPPDPPGSSGER